MEKGWIGSSLGSNKGRRLCELAFLLIALLVVFLLSESQLIKAFELKSLDYRFRLRGPRRISEDIKIIVIDDPSIEVFGRWPWARDHHAALVHLLCADERYKPRVIGYDILFTEADRAHPEYDETLAEQTRLAGNLCYAYFFPKEGLEEIPQKSSILERSFLPHVEEPRDGLLKAKNVTLPLPELTRYAQVGFSNIPPDSDGSSRWTPLVMEYRGRYYPSLALQMAFSYLGIEADDIKVIPARHIEIKKSRIGSFKIPIDPKGRMLINYAGDIEAFGGYPFLEVVRAATQGEGGQRPTGLTDLKDKLVIVGLTAAGTSDLRATPFSSKSPMIIAHASVINDILRGDFLVRAGRSVNILIFLFMAVTVGLSSIHFRPLKSALAFILALMAVFGLTYYLFVHGLWIDMVRPTLGVLAVYLAVTGYRYGVEEKEKRWVKRAFAHYLPANVMNEILMDPSKLKLGGERRELSVLFSDIRGFTKFCESRSPEEVVARLNEYFDRMTEVVFRHSGTLDKYIGDAMIVIFGAPSKEVESDHARRACLTALDMMKELKLLQDKWREEGSSPLHIGISINTGEMVVGNLGSTKIMDYTVIGDEVNIAARLQGLTRKYGKAILITEATYNQVKDTVEAKRLAEVQVKGRTRPIAVYELIGLNQRRLS